CSQKPDGRYRLACCDFYSNAINFQRYTFVPKEKNDYLNNIPYLWFQFFQKVYDNGVAGSQTKIHPILGSTGFQLGYQPHDGPDPRIVAGSAGGPERRRDHGRAANFTWQ